MSDTESFPSACRTAQSIRRIMREYDEIKSSKNPYWTAQPIKEEEPYEWHFTVRGPLGTEFEGGIYHGRIVLPQNYPLAPPSFTLLNQNGRFEVGRKVCLSASNYHPELWQPAWGIRTMLDALHAFFSTPCDGALHSLNWPAELRRQLAIESPKWKCPVCGEDNATLVATYCEEPTPRRPTLPSSMIPPSIARAVPYLRERSSSVTQDGHSAAPVNDVPPPEATEEQRRTFQSRVLYRY
ncbi:ubiquitin-conjugating enzyme E2 J1-like [Condylostylus longicornis]|uniref:ubiquitin-conjugating enzyme E2 J1-like n=1 Tax=Condylostylus longicornis TaxID=2530218 RepID=UPI00244DAC31|nr:ubiquitin-conjugating enzyme E2 J1-like [Condylostylus longicornis]